MFVGQLADVGKCCHQEKCPQVTQQDWNVWVMSLSAEFCIERPVSPEIQSCSSTPIPLSTKLRRLMRLEDLLVVFDMGPQCTRFIPSFCIADRLHRVLCYPCLNEQSWLHVGRIFYPCAVHEVRTVQGAARKNCKHATRREYKKERMLVS